MIYLQCMIDCDSESLVSSGVDHLVIVWRVGISFTIFTTVINSKFCCSSSPETDSQRQKYLTGLIRVCTVFHNRTI